MEALYAQKLKNLGYTHLVCDLFGSWENVKDEILLPERKEGSGNGTVHVFLGNADNELRQEFASYYDDVTNGANPSDGAIEVKHFFSPNNVISMLGHICKYYYDKNEDAGSTIPNILAALNNAPDESGLIYTTSYFKLSEGSSKLRPYFKQFDRNGIFHTVIRPLLTAESSYKISLYKNDEGEYAALWLIGFDDFSDFEASSDSKHFGSTKTGNESAIDEYKKLLLKHHNLVLTGAPGTGKTFMARELAANVVCGKHWDELSEEDKLRVGFVQFHPSYDYTDFVEGLRPISGGEDAMSFRRTDGVFKQFCKRALPVKTIFMCKYNELAKDIASGKADFGTDSKSFFVVDGRIRVKSKDGRPAADEKKSIPYEKIEALFTYFVENPDRWETESTREGFNKIIASSSIDSNYVDYYAKPVVQELLNKSKGLFINTDPNKKYVFIVDEINRGELSKIFGELFFAIDPGYRGEKGMVTTQYQNLVEQDDVFHDGFYIPENVYVIGTMNDIDRGVEAMDFAIRRRFAWKEVTAAESAENMSISDLGKVKMSAINEAIIKSDLGEAYCIGAAFFRDIDTEGSDNLWKYSLKGIVSEYFRGDPDAINKIKSIEDAYKSASVSLNPEETTAENTGLEIQ